VTLGDLSGPADLELEHPRFRLRLESRGVVDVDLCGQRVPALVTHLAAPKPVFVNGCAVAAKRDAFSGRLEIAVPAAKRVPQTDPALPKYVARMEALMRVAVRGESGAARRLRAGLGDRDWKVRQVAAELLGRCGDTAAVPALEKATGYAEINTKVRARDAIHRIGEGGPMHADYPDRSDG